MLTTTSPRSHSVKDAESEKSNAVGILEMGKGA